DGRMPGAYVGRMLAIGGIVTGLLALGLPYVSAYGERARYVDDGTAAGFLLVLLCFSSWFPAQVGRDELTAAAGAAAFGFFLFFVTAFAFAQLGYLGSGAWLGLCAALIPIGALLVPSERRALREPRRPSAGMGAAATLVGVALLVAGIWLDADAGESYWTLSASGHAVGILMLLLAALNL